MENEVSKSTEETVEKEASLETKPIKAKKKLVLAKDKKEAALAILVMTVFILNGIYMIIKYIIENKVG